MSAKVPAVPRWIPFHTCYSPPLVIWLCTCGEYNDLTITKCDNCGGGCPTGTPPDYGAKGVVSREHVIKQIEGILKANPPQHDEELRGQLEVFCDELFCGKGGEKPIYTVDAFNRLWDERMKASEILFETQRKIRRELGRELRRQSEEIARKLKEMEL